MPKRQRPLWLERLEDEMNKAQHPLAPEMVTLILEIDPHHWCDHEALDATGWPVEHSIDPTQPIQ